MFLLNDGAQDDSLHDFNILIKRETRFAYPYLIVAHRALADHDYVACAALCDAGSLRADGPALRANFLEWMAISRCELGAPAPLVLPLFEEALALDPVNARIQRNRKIFERRIGGQDGYGATFEIQLPEQKAASGM